MVTVINWNVNSVKSRQDGLIKLLEEKNPDIVTLQELKCVSEAFPKEEIEHLGYNIAVNGQKTYNGVAVLSKFPIEEIITEFPNDPDPSQSRYIEVVIAYNDQIYRIVSVYVPNGQEVGSDKYNYKMDFLAAFYDHAQGLLSHKEKLVMCGDYNIAPFDQDVYDAAGLKNSLCFSAPEQQALRKFLFNGFNDSYRLIFPHEGNKYTWWDYRGLSWQKNQGMRIDHILLSNEAADCLSDFNIDLKTRGQERPSDHAPIIATFI